MTDYVETFREEHVWQTDWKVLAENFMESYHLFKLHRGTVGPHSRVDEMQCPRGDGESAHMRGFISLLLLSSVSHRLTHNGTTRCELYAGSKATPSS